MKRRSLPAPTACPRHAPRPTLPKPRLLTALALALSLSGCVLMQPKGYTEATTQLDQGDYESSTRSFEQLAAENPDNESVQTALSESRYKVAEAAFNQGESTAEHNLRKRIELYRKSTAVAGQSLAALKTLLARPYDGPSVADRAQKMMVAEYRSPRERQEIQNRQTADLHARATLALQKTSGRLEQVLADSQRLLEKNRSAPGSAYDEFVPLFPFAPHLAEVQAAKTEVEQITVAHLEKTGLEQVERKDYAGATQNFERLGKVEGGEQRGIAGGHAIVAHQAFMAKNYDAAYDAMVAVRKAYPESPFLRAYYEKTQGLVIGVHIKAIDKQIATGKTPGMIEAFDRLMRLIAVAEGNAALGATLEPRRATLRKKIAADYIRQALALRKQDEALYSGLILRHLRIARQLDPEQADAHEAVAAKALGATQRKAELKVLVAFGGGNDGRRAELANRLNTDLMSAIEQQGLPGVSTVDRAAGSPGDLVSADVVIQGSVDAVEFVEGGRDAPRRKSSKYVSGTRQVKNPRYDQAKEAYEEAEQTYQKLRVAADASKRECRRLDNVIARIACEAAISYFSSADRDSAYAAFKSTPEYVPENIISGYQYDEYTVRLNGQIRGQCKLVDNLTRSEAACTPINEKIKREGTIVRNAQARDTEGIRNRETDVPDIGREQEALFSSISAAVSADLVKRVAASRTERYCRLAENLDKRGSRQNAAEAYSLCLTIAGKDLGDRAAQFEARLNTHFGITPAQVQAFATVPAETVAKWPEAEEAEEKSIKVALGRLSR